MLNSKNYEKVKAFTELERGVKVALETYSNVHRGSGHFSLTTTHLYDQSRDIVLEYLGLDKAKYTVIFCTPRRAEVFTKQLKQECYQVLSDLEIGLALGVRAVAVKRQSLPKGVPFQTGGGTTKHITEDWVIWADTPDKFEAGTPAIINIIAFAKSLLLIKQLGKDIFKDTIAEKLSAAEILYFDQFEKYSGLELLNELRKTLIGQSVSVPTMTGIKTFINLDNSASTPTFTPVWDAFRQTIRQSAQVKQEIVHKVKSICADFLGASQADYDLIYTSNTTEAINLAAESFSRQSADGIEPVVLNTISEHSSNDLPWRMFANYSLTRLSVNDEGFVDLKELESVLISYNLRCQFGKKRIKLIAVNGASNVLGVCNDLTEIGRIAHQYGAHLLVDAAQLVAHRKIDMKCCEIDYLAFSGHKIYAPFGCGVLMVRKGLLNFNPDELKLIKSSGEENAGGIAALGKSLVLMQRIGMELIEQEERTLTETALRGLAGIPGLKIYGVRDPESPEFSHKLGVIAFELKNKMPNKIGRQLAIQSGIGVRTGCHCAHIIIMHLMHVGQMIKQLQKVIQILFPKFRFLGVLRVSFGIENSREDIVNLIDALNKIVKPQKESDGSNSPVLSQKEATQKLNDFVKDAYLKVYSNYSGS